jgi:transposase
LGIPNQGTLYAWEKLYLEKGESALLDTAKGRPANMSKKQNSPKKKDEQLTREQELEAENARLRMENAYLKKLKALVAEREKSERKTK